MGVVLIPVVQGVGVGVEGDGPVAVFPQHPDIGGQGLIVLRVQVGVGGAAVQLLRGDAGKGLHLHLSGATAAGGGVEPAPGGLPPEPVVVGQGVLREVQPLQPGDVEKALIHHKDDVGSEVRALLPGQRPLHVLQNILKMTLAVGVGGGGLGAVPGAEQAEGDAQTGVPGPLNGVGLILVNAPGPQGEGDKEHQQRPAGGGHSQPPPEGEGVVAVQKGADVQHGEHNKRDRYIGDGGPHHGGDGDVAGGEPGDILQLVGQGQIGQGEGLAVDGGFVVAGQGQGEGGQGGQQTGQPAEASQPGEDHLHQEQGHAVHGGRPGGGDEPVPGGGQVLKADQLTGQGGGQGADQNQGQAQHGNPVFFQRPPPNTQKIQGGGLPPP